jgi:hypothetical protein
MSKTRNLSDLLDANGDVKSTALDNVPASNDASALTTGTLDNARLATNVSVSGDLTVDTDTLKVDSTNNRVGIGVANPSQALEVNGNILLGDNDKILLGSSDDLQIYHDGSNSYIKDVGTGQLFIETNGNRVLIRDSNGDNLGDFNNNGSVYLSHVSGGISTTRLQTTSSGATVTGDLNVTGNLLTRKFFGYGVSSGSNASGWRTINFGTEVEDDDSRFAHTSGTYTVGESGTFLLVGGHHHTNGSHGTYQIRFHSNVHGWLAGIGADNSDMIAISMFHDATLNEVLSIKVYHDNTAHADAGGRHSFFGGYFVK